MIAEIFVPCTLGLEQVLADELKELGAGDVAVGRGGVSCAGDRHLAYSANLWLRSGIRVQELIGRGEVRNSDDLYAWVKEIDWSQYLRVDQTLVVDASVADSGIRHSRYAEHRVKDAIVDQWREATGRRPSVDRKAADLPLKLVIRNDRALLYRDLSGQSLHKRGWRPIQVRSPLNEATAAGLLMLSGWDRASPLVDPMCGSGTFVIEAAHLATGRAPGLGRHFAFERWMDFDRELWNKLRREAEGRIVRSLSFSIEGADRHAGALGLARRAAAAADVRDLVRFSVSPMDRFRPLSDPVSVVTNPPYGRRLGEGDDLIESWRHLGIFLKQHCRGGSAYVLSGEPSLTRHLGLRSTRKWPVMNGSIECRLIRYDIHRAEAHRHE